jgi:hypothetical protein
MRSVRQALVAIVAVGLSGPLDAAERMPAELQGVWARKPPAACDVPAPDDMAELPFLIVTPEGFAAHEMQCEAMQVRAESPAPTGTTWALTFSCSGEGDHWTKTEHWSIQRNATTIRSWQLTGRHLLKDGEAFTQCTLEAAPTR